MITWLLGTILQFLFKHRRYPWQEKSEGAGEILLLAWD